MSNSNNNQISIPQAREAGSVGGQMVRKNCSIRTAGSDMPNRIAAGHVQTVQYIAAITIVEGNILHTGMLAPDRRLPNASIPRYGKSGRFSPTAFVIPANPPDCPHPSVRTYPGR